MNEDTEFLDLLQDAKDLLAYLSVTFGIVALASIASCTREQQTQVRTVLEAADQGLQNGCVLFEKLKIDQEHVEDVCMGSEEVREAIADFQRRKALSRASAASSTPPAPPASSTPPAPPASSTPPASTAPSSGGKR